MSPKVLLIVIGVAAGAVAGATGLYFGTDLFERDPLAGMEAQPGVALGPDEALVLDTAEAAEILEERSRLQTVDAVAAREFERDSPPTTTARLATASGEPIQPAVMRTRETAPRPEAEEAERSASEAAGDAGRARVLAWKSSYPLAEATPQAAPRQAGEPLPTTVRIASRSDREAAPAQHSAAAETVDGADIEPAELREADFVSGIRRLEWKTSPPLIEATPSVVSTEVAQAPVADVGAVEQADPEAPPTSHSVVAESVDSDEIEAAELPQADHLGGVRRLEWKTSLALTSVSAEIPDPKTVPDASDPAARLTAITVEAVEAPSASAIAIATVEFEEPDRLHVSGLTDPLMTVLIDVNDRFLARTRADASGTWSALGSRDLPPGRYTVAARAVDDGGTVHASAQTRFDRVQVIVAEEPPGPPDGPRLPDTLAEELDLGLDDGPKTVHIERGDNLWHIARAIYGRGSLYTAIYEMNRNQITNPDLIYPGQIFTVPVLDEAG